MKARPSFGFFFFFFFLFFLFFFFLAIPVYSTPSFGVEYTGMATSNSVEPDKKTKKSLLKRIFGGGKQKKKNSAASHPETRHPELSATDAPSDVPQPNTNSQPNYPLFVGKHAYLSQTDSGLGFTEGDLLYILNKDDKDWWFAKAKHSGQEGYIPSNYVAEYESPDDQSKGENASSKVLQQNLH